MRDKKTQWLFGDVRICKGCRRPMDRDGLRCSQCLKQAKRDREIEKNKRWQGET